MRNSMELDVDLKQSFILSMFMYIYTCNLQNYHTIDYARWSWEPVICKLLGCSSSHLELFRMKGNYLPKSMSRKVGDRF